MKILERYQLKQPDRIFIVPTLLGSLLTLVILLLLTTAAFFSDSDMYVFTFVLVTIGIMAMLLTNSNLKGLSSEPHPDILLLEGHAQTLLMMISNKSNEVRFSFYLSAYIASKKMGSGLLAAINSKSSRKVELKQVLLPRGKHSIERIKAESSYPFGLLRAWRLLNCQTIVYVYPQPKGIPLKSKRTEQKHSDAEVTGSSIEESDFAGLRAYRPGDSQKHVNWKAVAKGHPMVVKEFAGADTPYCDFKWSEVSSMGQEAKLRQLSLWLHEAYEANYIFSLELPEQSLGRGQGQAHFAQCLKLLAGFES